MSINEFIKHSLNFKKMKNLTLIALLTLSVNIADAKWQNYDQADNAISIVIAAGESDMNAVNYEEDSCFLYSGDAGTATCKSPINENINVAERDPALTSLANAQAVNNLITVSANNSLNNNSVSHIRPRNPFVICLGIICEIILVFVYASEN